MSAAEITSNEQAMQVLNRASCIALTLEQLLRQAQFEEPVCSSALAETLSITYDLINEVYNYLDGIEISVRRTSKCQADTENA